MPTCWQQKHLCRVKKKGPSTHQHTPEKSLNIYMDTHTRAHTLTNIHNKFQKRIPRHTNTSLGKVERLWLYSVYFCTRYIPWTNALLQLQRSWNIHPFSNHLHYALLLLLFRNKLRKKKKTKRILLINVSQLFPVATGSVWGSRIEGVAGEGACERHPCFVRCA